MRKIREACGSYQFFCARSVIGLLGIGASSAAIVFLLIRAADSQRPATVQSAIEDIAAPACLIAFLLLRHMGSYPKASKTLHGATSFFTAMTGFVAGALIYSLINYPFDQSCKEGICGLQVVGFFASLIGTGGSGAAELWGFNEEYNTEETERLNP